MHRWLFLCSDNSALSPMAAALAQLYLPPGFKASSAGLRAAPAFEARLGRMLDELGLPLADAAPRSLAMLADRTFERCIWLGPTEAAPAELNVDAQWAMAEPAMLDDAAYRLTRDRLAARVRRWIAEDEPGR